MTEQDHDYGKLTDHEYDGIREYDNPCPTWWHLIFLGTFVFSLFYYFFFLGSFGWTVAEAYDSAVAENLKLRFEEIGELDVDEKTLVEYMAKDDWLAIGASVYQAQCKSCHGADGAGLVGPNLTEDNYKHVKELLDIAKVVQDGASAGAMPAWKNRLHPNEVVLVSAYVANLRGKNVAGLGDAVEKRDGKYKPIPAWPTAAEVAVEEEAKVEEVLQSAPGEVTEPASVGTPSPGADMESEKADPVEEPTLANEGEEPAVGTPMEKKKEEENAPVGRTNPLRRNS
jgi:cytochrome c oxidase cbb3-type subunit III